MTPKLIGCLFGLLAMAPAFGASVDGPAAPPSTFKDVPGQPHTFVIQVDSTAAALVPAKLVELRNYLSIWAAPTGWKLAAKDQPATAILRVSLVPSKGEKARAPERAMIWSDYAYADNGADTELADRESTSYYVVPVGVFGYPFDDWDLTYADFYFGAAPYYLPTAPQHHHPSPVCPPKAAPANAIRLVESFALRAPPGGRSLPAAPRWVAEIARANAHGELAFSRAAGWSSHSSSHAGSYQSWSHGGSESGGSRASGGGEHRSGGGGGGSGGGGHYSGGGGNSGGSSNSSNQSK